MKHRPKGMTQADCAELAGITRQTVAKIERGENVRESSRKSYLKVCGMKDVTTNINS